jgi:hypothetical protein
MAMGGRKKVLWNAHATYLLRTSEGYLKIRIFLLYLHEGLRSELKPDHAVYARWCDMSLAIRAPITTLSTDRKILEQLDSRDMV